MGGGYSVAPVPSEGFCPSERYGFKYMVIFFLFLVHLIITCCNLAEHFWYYLNASTLIVHLDCLPIFCLLRGRQIVYPFLLIKRKV